mgnify:CR=1 FL=1
MVEVDEVYFFPLPIRQGGKPLDALDIEELPGGELEAAPVDKVLVSDTIPRSVPSSTRSCVWTASISSRATLAVAVSDVNADLMNVEQAASTMRCAGNTRPSTRTWQSQSCSSRHIRAMTWLRELAISSLATVTTILSRVDSRGTAATNERGTTAEGG